MKTFIFATLLFYCSSSSLFGQKMLQCGVGLANDQSIVDIEQANKLINKYIATRKHKTQSTKVYTIPIVVHVIHLGEEKGVGSNISDEQIQSGIQQINDHYLNKNNESTDIGIQFELAKKDPNCSPTNGINRVDGRVLAEYETYGVRRTGEKGTNNTALNQLSGWSFEDYINVWIVTQIDDEDSTGTVGYATSPVNNPPFDGLVVIHKHWGNQGSVFSWSSEGKVGTHEFGHFLGLYHTTEGDGDGTLCPAPNGCGTDLGDCCDDTSPHHKTDNICLIGKLNDCTGEEYDDVINNYMNPTVGSCSFKFTPNQKQRVLATLHTIRKGLINSDGLSTSNINFTPPIAATCIPQTDALGLSDGYAGITLVSIKNVMEQKSSSANIDKGYLDRTNECKNYAFLQQDSTYELKISVWANTNIVKSWIDFNNNGSFENDELVFDKIIKDMQTDSMNFSIPESAVTEQFLRMRVLNDLSSFENACHNPQYGQAEDYTVFIKKSNILSSLSSSNQNNRCVVFPQPFEDKLQVDYKNDRTGSTTQYQITNMLGVIVQQGNATIETDSFVIETGTLASGMYLLTVTNTNGRYATRIVKK